MRQFLTFLNTYSRQIYLFGIFTTVIGLSVSKPLIISGLIIILLIWLLGDKIKNRITSFLQNKTAVFLSSIYLLTLFGLLYTSNFDYALGDARRKLALFSLPFLIAGFPPITNQEWKLIFKIYVSGVLVASFWSFFIFLGGLETVIIDVREYSRFNSHIRFGLEICFAIFGGIYFLRQEKKNTNKIIWILIITWLIVFSYLISLFTGLVIFGLTTLILLSFIGFSYNKPWVKYIVYLGLIALFGFVLFTFNNIINSYQTQQHRTQLPTLERTEKGEVYFSEIKSIRKNEKENGYFVWKNIAWKELEQSWNKRSQLTFIGEDLKGQDLSTTIIRYMSSKGLYKDTDGVKQLTAEDVLAIEKGVPNSIYLRKNNFEKRLIRILWEFEDYKNGRDFNGHSVIMRWEYWQTAYHIFKQNFWLGVGTGDLQDAFNTQYEKDNSILKPQYRLRAHNQYITYAVTYGLLGIFCFGLFLIYPFIKNKMYNNFIYLAFFSIALLSMLTEDTLETQVGIHFFALFNSILLLKAKTKPQTD